MRCLRVIHHFMMSNLSVFIRCVRESIKNNYQPVRKFFFYIYCMAIINLGHNLCYTNTLEVVVYIYNCLLGSV